jgi:hypothetical protein
MNKNLKEAIECRMTRGYGLDLYTYKTINTCLRENKIVYNKKTNEFIEK